MHTVRTEIMIFLFVCINLIAFNLPHMLWCMSCSAKKQISEKQD